VTARSVVAPWAAWTALAACSPRSPLLHCFAMLELSNALDELGTGGKVKFGEAIS
jgi:hypothetical protein